MYKVDPHQVLNIKGKARQKQTKQPQKRTDGKQSRRPFHIGNFVTQIY